MANRRAIGRGILGASDIFLNFFANQMKEKQLRERQAEDDKRAAENAKALSEQKTNEQAATNLLKGNPVTASRRLSIPLAQEDTVRPIVEEISKVTKPESMLGLNDILGRIKANGGQTWAKTTDPGGQGLNPLTIDAIKQNVARGQQVESEARMPDTQIEETAPDGSKTTRFVSKRAGGTYSTGLSAEQEGVNAGVKAVAEAPGKGKAASSVIDATRSAEAKTAGAKASAEANARLNAEFSPQNMKNRLEMIRQEGIAKALAARNTKHAEDVDNLTKIIVALQPDLATMQKLSAKVNTTSGRQPMTWAAGKLQAGPRGINAAELDSFADNLSKRLANDPALGGNKGAQSEADSQAIRGRLPNSSDSKEVAERKIKDFNKTLYDSLNSAANMDMSATPQDRLNVVREHLGLPLIDFSKAQESGITPPAATDARGKLEMLRKRGRF